MTRRAAKALIYTATVAFFVSSYWSGWRIGHGEDAFSLLGLVLLASVITSSMVITLAYDFYYRATRRS